MIEEIRNKKYGGSMKPSEFKMLETLSKKMKLSQVDVIVAGLKLLRIQFEQTQEQGIFEKIKKK
jgi:hypothetical protein